MERGVNYTKDLSEADMKSLSRGPIPGGDGTLARPHDGKPYGSADDNAKRSGYPE